MDGKPGRIDGDVEDEDEDERGMSRQERDMEASRREARRARYGAHI